MTAYLTDNIFLYIFLFCSLIFIIPALIFKNKFLKTFFIVLFSLFVSLGAAEFICSLTCVKYFPPYEYRIKDINETRLRSCRAICFFNSSGAKQKIELGPENIDNYDKNGEYIYNALYNCYSNGLRYTKCNPDSQKTYIFLGCSMVFGEGLNDEETLPYYFSKLMNFDNNVINCGIRGHATNTALNILNGSFVEGCLKKSRVEYFIYSLIDDHLYRNFRMSEPGDIWLYSGGRCFEADSPFRFVKHFFKRSCLFRNVFLKIIERHNKPFYEEYLVGSLKQMDKIIREKYKSRLIIIKWRSDSSILEKKMKDAGLQFILLPVYCEENGYTIKNDGHPAPKANEEIARILYNKINNGV